MPTSISVHIPYQPIPVRTFWQAAGGKEKVQVFGLWVVSLVASIGLGVASIAFEWSGLPVRFGGVEVYLTLYPPLVICTLWVFWMGFWWGFIPAYLATLTLALYSQMPVGWALVFALADPIGLAIFALAYRVIPISPRLYGLNSLLFFAFLCFISGIMGSTGSFIWTYTNGLGVREVLPIWQGWWLGAFLQTLLVNGLLIFLGTAAVMRWKARRFARSDAPPLERRYVILFAVVLLSSIMGYFFVLKYFTTTNVAAALETGYTGTVPVHDLLDGVAVIYWVTVILVATMAFFGYQVFNSWIALLRENAETLEVANQQLQDENMERKKAEEQSQEYAQELATANANKDKFFSIVAHDLRGPVGSVRGLLRLFNEVLSDGDLDTVEELTGVAQNAMDNVAGLLENLLRWAQAQTGHLQVQPVAIQVDSLVYDCLALVGPLASQKSINLAAEVDDRLAVWGDRNMVHSVLQNLLTNALKFTNTDGTVRIEAMQAGGDVHLSVADNGVGMTPNELEKLFRIDVKYSGIGTQGERGTGLGLMLCKEMIEMNGGALWMESEKGTGTTVRFTLPLAAPERTATIAPQRKRRAPKYPPSGKDA